MSDLVGVLNELKNKILSEIPISICFMDEMIRAYELLKFEKVDDEGLSYIDKDVSLSLVRNFLKEISSSYVDLFDEQDILMVKEDDIEGMKEKATSAVQLCRLEILLDNGSTTIFFGNSDKREVYINLLMQNNIIDVFRLLHEFIHFVTIDNVGLLDEVCPILGELVFTDYLSNKKYFSKDLEFYWNYRHKTLRQIDADFYYLLKLFKMQDYGIDVDDGRSVHLLVKSLLEKTNIVKYFKEMGDEDNVSHMVGYYYARMLYEVTPKDELLDLLNGMAYLKNNLSEKEYLDYIKENIGRGYKRKVKVREFD